MQGYNNMGSYFFNINMCHADGNNKANPLMKLTEQSWCDK